MWINILTSTKKRLNSGTLRSYVEKRGIIIEMSGLMAKMWGRGITVWQVVFM